MLEGKIVEGTDLNNKQVKGRVILIYDDAIRSGTIDYITVTYLMIVDKTGLTYTMRPRDVTKIADEY